MANDPALAGFDANAVRAGLRLAMTVGLAPDAGDQPTFFMPAVETSSAVLDQGGVPFSPAGQRTFAPRTSFTVPCGVEYQDGPGKLENFGVIVPSKVILTLLDEDYDVVKGFEFVVISGTRYFYRRTEPQKGLVTLGIWKVHCVSEDQV